jgi:cation diffusion facilitator CzcD-associated flavoprotein CzcO
LKEVEKIEVAIIGAGFAGIGAAIKLKKAGIESIKVFERKKELGGTWRDNTYPGCACDIPSFLYSYSFEPNPEWSESFSSHNEILAYLNKCASKYDLYKYIQFETAIVSANFKEHKGYWEILDNKNNYCHARSIISCSGPLNEPIYPDIKNKEAFEGELFHSLNWNHKYDLKNKKVAVIGTGASAIQFVPEIAPLVGELTVFQRTAPWISPKNNQAINEISKNRFRRFPAYQKFWREFIYWFLEFQGLSQYKDNKIRAWRKKLTIEHRTSQIKDNELLKKTTPNYEIGCKRILISDNYYPTLERENVNLETTSIKRFTKTGIELKDGQLLEFDVVIFGTGFKTTTFDHIYDVIGLDNRNLFKEWDVTGAEAYKGINVSGFPNFMLVVGPNTGLGHNSIIHMMESQYNYIVDYILKLKKQPYKSFNIKSGIQKKYNNNLHKKLEPMIWNKGGCNSYYLKDGKGKNTSIWPGTTISYRKLTRKVNLNDFEILKIKS